MGKDFDNKFIHTWP